MKLISLIRWRNFLARKSSLRFFENWPTSQQKPQTLCWEKGRNRNLNDPCDSDQKQQLHDFSWILVFVCFGLLPRAQAVVLAAVHCRAILVLFNTGRGLVNRLFSSLTTGVANTGLGACICSGLDFLWKPQHTAVAAGTLLSNVEDQSAFEGKIPKTAVGRGGALIQHHPAPTTQPLE